MIDFKALQTVSKILEYIKMRTNTQYISLGNNELILSTECTGCYTIGSYKKTFEFYSEGYDEYSYIEVIIEETTDFSERHHHTEWFTFDNERIERCGNGRRVHIPHSQMLEFLMQFARVSINEEELETIVKLYRAVKRVAITEKEEREEREREKKRRIAEERRLKRMEEIEKIEKEFSKGGRELPDKHFIIVWIEYGLKSIYMKDAQELMSGDGYNIYKKVIDGKKVHYVITDRANERAIIVRNDNQEIERQLNVLPTIDVIKKVFNEYANIKKVLV